MIEQNNSTKARTARKEVGLWWLDTTATQLFQLRGHIQKQRKALLSVALKKNRHRCTAPLPS